MDFLNELFNQNRISPLQRKNDLEYEVKYHNKLISKRGFEIISTIPKGEEILILYRHFYEDIPNHEETSIILGIRVISKDGTHYPDPMLKAFFNADFNMISLADIEIAEPLSNHGYGSILLSNLIQIAKARNINNISGWISNVDSDHLDRLVHFYKKHDFKVSLEGKRIDSHKIGELVWQNIL
ncbi:GNAT family N-acetyltransferase [Bacillus sp. FJAT-47783]|uniref:GNAT family N-acetyltransferase n=1 Tax=Bacillus sp. FJAT-47783 TaxID=2922712 RepID=UPI001FAC17E7|nr:GNAT family N-acetyltransferase [Bacillus sp. FJAT-47783]